MDGVLIDAKEWHYESLNKALSHFGYSISRYDHLFTFDGLPTRKKLELLTREQGLPLGLHSFLNDLKQCYTIELIHARCKPVFQHEFALSKLRQQGLKLGVASNSVKKSVELMMEKSSLKSYLDVMMSNEDVKEPKPAPDMYLVAAEKLQVDPRECLVVEDNPKGIESAIKAGCNVMVVNTVLDVTLDNIENNIQRYNAVA